MKDNYIISFAPLQGYNDYIYRNHFNDCFGGVDFYYSSFIRLMPDGTIRKKDIKDISNELNKISCDPKNLILKEKSKAVNPCFIPQILGGKAEDVDKLLGLITSEGYSSVDINLGCPFPMIANKGNGSGLLKCETGENKRFIELMEIIQNHGELSVSLKMRLGWSSIRESIQLLPIINATPLSSVTMHARLGVQGYNGKCDLEGFKEFYDGCGHKLQYNGDIRNVDDFKKVTKMFPRLYGVMIGRGLLSDPFLAIDISNADNERINSMEDNNILGQRLSILRKFHDKLLVSYSEKLQGEQQILTKMKGLWDYFLPATDKKLLKKIKKSNKLSSYISIVDSIFN